MNFVDRIVAAGRNNAFGAAEVEVKISYKVNGESGIYYTEQMTVNEVHMMVGQLLATRFVNYVRTQSNVDSLVYEFTHDEDGKFADLSITVIV